MRSLATTKRASDEGRRMMKVEMNTKDRTVYVVANDIAQDLETIDKWLKALRVAREWLRKELSNAPQ
jgi:hypothetical protein